MIDWLNDNSGAVQGIAAIVSLAVLFGLAVVTGWYAVLTRRIAKASESQATAAVEMTLEMNKERLSADQPYLLIEMMNLDKIEWDRGIEDIWTAKDKDDFPKVLAYRVRNAGRGPATEITTVLLHPKAQYSFNGRDVLSAGDAWDVESSFSPMDTALIGDTDGFGAWLRRASGDDVGQRDCDLGIVVTCRDIHERRWLTYVAFDVRVIINVGKRLMPIKQRLVALQAEVPLRPQRTVGEVLEHVEKSMAKDDAEDERSS